MTDCNGFDQPLLLEDGCDLELEVPSSATKRNIVDLAYAKCRLAGYQFDVSPEELDSALTQLDNMMSEWAVTGIDLGYNQPVVYGTGNLEDQSGIPNAAVQAASLSLALRIAPDMGKTLTPGAMAALAQSLQSLRSLTTCIPRMGFPAFTPAGAGNLQWWGYGYGQFMPFGRRRC